MIVPISFGSGLHFFVTTNVIPCKSTLPDRRRELASANAAPPSSFNIYIDSSMKQVSCKSIII